MYQLPNRLLNYTSALWILACCCAGRLRLAVEAFQPPQHLRLDVTNGNLICTNRYCNAIKETRRQDNKWGLQDQNHCGSTFRLYMAAGSKSLNKQAALRQKLEQAKQQNYFEQQEHNTTVSSSSSSGYPLSDKEIRERNDRLRFEELLQKKGGAFVDSSENDKEYKTRQQEDDEIDAIRKYCTCFSHFIYNPELSLLQLERRIPGT